MRRLAALLVILCSFVTSACFSIEQTMTFEKDLSGTAGVRMQVDMERIADFAAMLKHSLTEKPGKPSEADIAEARKEVLATAGTRKPIDFEKEKKAAEAGLPAGVKLVEATFKDDGLKMMANVVLGFDHASKLEQINFAKKPAAAAPDVDGGSPMDTPFGGLKVVDEGKTLLVTSPARHPMGQEPADMGDIPMDAELKSLLDSLLGGIRVAVKLTTPFQVLEHNAHRKEGNTLVWDYNYASLQKMTLDEIEQGVRVRYKK